ncbi:MAG: DUF2130 domain-containing protein [Pseudomonadales bacterium]|nr:DUF2130 domain-containing protein [Candidatus Woesebacteria bacterium]MCB9800927.1 DUF2130 domain-containing protein [Pseudomonadales bacterium]
MAADQTITCPDCGAQIPFSKALSEQVEHKLKHQLEKQKQEFEASLKKQLDDQLSKEKKRLWQVAQEKAAEKQDKELKDLQEQLKENSKKLEESEKNELELRKKSRELEEREKKIELEMARKLDEERKKIVESTKKEEAEQQRLKLQEKDKQLEIMRKQIDDLKRKAEQGSMQIQGEVQEDDLKELLSTTFVKDEVSDVPQGIKGADLIQKVNARFGAAHGTIIWESKNTKAFSEKWISKLKQDQGIVQAEAAILVTRVLPEGVEGFGLVNGVWVVGYTHIIPLASALRLHISEVAKVKLSLVGRDEKMDLLYQYLSGAQFKNRIENIVMAFMSMKQDLETEKRSFQRLWTKREKELEKVVMSTSSLYGDLQGIIGGSLPTIQHLEFLGSGSEALEEAIEDDSDGNQTLF